MSSRFISAHQSLGFPRPHEVKGTQVEIFKRERERERAENAGIGTKLLCIVVYLLVI